MAGDGTTTGDGDMAADGEVGAEGDRAARRSAGAGGKPGGAFVRVHRGEPTDEEVAAIVAAVEVAWPRPALGGGPERPEPYRWRFSGRWWAKPVPVRRDRPAHYL